METIEELKRRIQSTQDLQSVVKTMKSLAAVKIRQYEKAVEALADYNRTVEMGLRVVLQDERGVREMRPVRTNDRIGAVVFGSDQGMCGQLNDQVVSHALRTMERLEVSTDLRALLAVGLRVTARLEAERQPVEETFSLPSSVDGISAKVQEILLRIEAWNEVHGLNQVFLFYSRQLSGATYRPYSVRLLPVDRQWLEDIRKTPWPTHMLPLFTMDRDRLFSTLIRQYLFVSLFRAFAESSASENASRLASMQGAEKNIREQLTELNNRYHQQRQMAITEELLDIVSGFEALESDW
jgi:F-type H+-transporting ATPase subunit gamma